MQLGFKTPITGLQVAYDYKADHGCWPRHVAHLADGRKVRRTETSWHYSPFKWCTIKSRTIILAPR